MFGVNLIFLGDRTHVMEVVHALCSAHPGMLNPDMLDMRDRTERGAIAVAALFDRYLVHELPPIASTEDLDQRLVFLRAICEQRIPLCFFSVQDNLRSLPTQNPYIRHAVFQDKPLAWFRENSEQLWAEAKFAWENPKEYAALPGRREAKDAPAPSRADRRRRR